MSVSNAERLLDLASDERDRFRRHLLVAAALTELFTHEPIVVGGVAEDYWAAGVYRPTDLDLCAPVTPAEAAALRRLGFQREGRHWYHDACSVAVEFPDETIDGDMGRTVLERVGGGRVRIIGVEDLYLDRVRRATVNERSEDDVAFLGALAVAAARFDEIDWGYVRARIREAKAVEGLVGEPMARIDRRIRRRARTAASE